MILFNNNPAKSTRITSPYGVRKHPITGKNQFHNGIDLGKLEKPSEAIFAVSNGYVIEQGYTSERGNFVVIQHEEFATLYQHLDNYITRTGQIVLANTVIGYMGTTGSSTGVHLHFEVFNGRYPDKQRVDPEQYIRR